MEQKAPDYIIISVPEFAPPETGKSRVCDIFGLFWLPSRSKRVIVVILGAITAGIWGRGGYGVNFWARSEVDGRVSGVRGQSAVVGMSHASARISPGWS